MKALGVIDRHEIPGLGKISIGEDFYKVSLDANSYKGPIPVSFFVPVTEHGAKAAWGGKDLFQLTTEGKSGPELKESS